MSCVMCPAGACPVWRRDRVWFIDAGINIYTSVQPFLDLDSALEGTFLAMSDAFPYKGTQVGPGPRRRMQRDPLLAPVLTCWTSTSTACRSCTTVGCIVAASRSNMPCMERPSQIGAEGRVW